MMKGLDLAAQLYSDLGVQLIAKEFPEYENRIAVGLVGDGSECYGFDDDLSQDHDWGPGFCLWLVTEDFNQIGPQLSQAYERLPTEYLGYQRTQSEWGSGRVGVFEIDQFYRKYIGTSAAPETLGQWLKLPENYLAACTSGRIFRDDLGIFTGIQDKLKGFYPEDVQRAKMGARCMQLGQSGQYNYWRSVKRSEFYAARYAAVKFCNDAMSLTFLLNRQYAPFYKWVHRAVKGMPVLGKTIHELVSRVTLAKDHEQIQNLMTQICQALIQEFHHQGLSQVSSESMLDHGQSIHDGIVDDDLRRVDVWYG